MLKKFTSVTVVLALFCALCVHTAFARGLSEPETKNNTAESASAPVGPGHSGVSPTEKPNSKLRADMLKLVRDAKAGKVIPAAKSQIQPAKSNNWSKSTKIAVGVGVAVAVVALILIVTHDRDPFPDGLTIF